VSRGPVLIANEVRISPSATRQPPRRRGHPRTPRRISILSPLHSRCRGSDTTVEGTGRSLGVVLARAAAGEQWGVALEGGEARPVLVLRCCRYEIEGGLVLTDQRRREKRADVMACAVREEEMPGVVGTCRRDRDECGDSAGGERCQLSQRNSAHCSSFRLVRRLTASLILNRV
jgi:hypothetical protein